MPTPTFFMSEVKEHDDLKGVGLVLLRLGPNIERRFAVNGEVAVFFAPWVDFQRRSYNAISRDFVEISDQLQKKAFERVRFSPSTKLVILISRDPAVAEKVSDWTQESASPTPVVALTESEITVESGLERLLDEMRSRMGDRDLYRAQNPVMGDDFFGRAGLLRDLATSIRGDENVAIFGLRRSGKTSVIRELKRSLAPQGVIVSITDLQMLEDIALEQITASVVRVLVEDLRTAKQAGQRVYVGSDTTVDSTLSLADQVRKIAARNRELRIVLAVDEIEHLVAFAHRNSRPARAFLGALRSAAQAAPNVSLLFSGVANTMFLSSSLGEGQDRQDNPMFGQVSATFLTPFTEEETRTLLGGVGGPMFLHWTDEAVVRVHGLTGGLPFFVRDLASTVSGHVAHKRAQSTAVVEVSSSEVEEVQNDWRANAARFWIETVRALEMHYPNAAYLLSPDVDESSLPHWLAGDVDMQEAAEALSKLGLLKGEAGRYQFTAALCALRELGAENSPKPIIVSPDRDKDILDLIRAGESHQLEFKQTARVDLASSEKKTYIEDSIVKSVAGFLNANGGTLLIGVADDGSLVGLDPDLALFGDDLDRFERWLLGDLLGRRLGQPDVTAGVRIAMPIVRGRRLVRVDVSPAASAVLVDEDALYVRSGNQTRQLKGREMMEFGNGRA